jgi:hypothetical protein
MSDKDLVLNPQMRVPDGSVISAKPSYLITLKEKSARYEFFVALDKPDTTRPHFVPTKGFYCDQNEDVIIANYKQLIQSIDKSKIIEIEFEASSIFSIRSLVYRAK